MGINMEKGVLTIREMAKYLNIGLNSAYALSRSKGFPCVLTVRRRIIPIRELEAWFKEMIKAHVT
jgi:excisionase family DNA binding protein